MAHSNTNYHNLCEWSERSRYPHRHRGGRKCYQGTVFYSRRGRVIRKPRYPQWTPQSCHGTPPMSIKRMWIRGARAKQRREMLRNPDDPVITPMKKLIDLWSWY